MVLLKCQNNKSHPSIKWRYTYQVATRKGHIPCMIVSHEVKIIVVIKLRGIVFKSERQCVLQSLKGYLYGPVCFPLGFSYIQLL